MGQGGRMSAVDSNSGGRDLEAIERAQRAHEPSMEEILASIRDIIGDERNAARGAAPKPPHPAPAPMPQIAHSADAPAPQGDAPELAQRPDAGGPTVVWRRPQVEEERAADAPHRNEEALMSPEAGEAAALSFGALSANLAVRSAELADELVRETLRPMLKQWLDENLPAIVERLVRAEIQRVARGGR